MNKFTRIIVAIVVLPVLMSCGQSEEQNEKPVLNLMKAADGKAYVLGCLRDNGIEAMADCEFNPKADQNSRGFHNRWGGGNYSYYFWNPVRFSTSSWGRYWGFPNNWWTNFGYPRYWQTEDNCSSCLYAPRPGKCLNRIPGCMTTLEEETEVN